MSNEPHEISSAGAERRARMLPLLQDAVRDRVQRKRRRRAVACSLFVFVMIIGLVEVMDQGPSVTEQAGNRLADVGAGTEPMPPVEIAGPEVPLVPTESVEPRLDIQSIDATSLYARAMERDPEVFVRTPVALPVDFRTSESRVVVQRLTTDQLMTELAVSGLDSAVICSDRGCRLFVPGKQMASADRDPSAAGQGT